MCVSTHKFLQTENEIRRSGVSDMQWLEIINIQSVKANAVDSQEIFKNLLNTAREQWPGPEVVLFQHSRLSSDFSFFLYHESPTADKRGSELGIHLAWQLKEYGYTNHTVWIETEQTYSKGGIK